MQRLWLAWVVLLGLGGAANAARIPIVYASGEEIIPVRDLPADLVMPGMTKLGFKYHYSSLMFVDVWRSDGEFVAYDGSAHEGTMYLPLGSRTLGELGTLPQLEGLLRLVSGESVPWRYYLPPGLLAILAFVEFLVIQTFRPRAKIVLVVGGVLVAVGGLLWIQGVGPAFIIPIALGGFHLYGVYVAMTSRDDAADTENEAENEAEPADETSRSEPAPAHRLGPAPTFETDPFRGPPRTAPIHVSRPATSEVAVKHDPDAPKPSLLS